MKLDMDPDEGTHEDDYPTNNKQHCLNDEVTTTPSSQLQSRRLFLGTATTTASSLLLMTAASSNNKAAWAGNPEVDRGSGLLYVPKSQMLGGGGSDATRGVPLKQGSTSRRLQPTQQLQNVYEPRFIAYLTRFLLNFDPAARGWWVENKLEEYTWERSDDDAKANSESGNNNNNSNNNNNNLRQIKFAEFSESVEVGLADYFVGPYGSYSSVRAALAGISATNPARSLQLQSSSHPNNNVVTRWWNDILHNWFRTKDDNDDNSNNNIVNQNNNRKKKLAISNKEMKMAQQGVLNLYALLKARYTSTTAKRQLALLFSLISSPELQPTAEIQALLGEADNATITKLDVIRPTQSPSQEQMMSRTSSRRGGGYELDQPPVIDIDPPPALGGNYLPAKGIPILQPTSRILRIQVTDPGEGYSQPPEVQVIGRCKRVCEACAILDRQGRVKEVVVLNPGFGYTSSSLLIKIDPPTQPHENNKDSKTADRKDKRAMPPPSSRFPQHSGRTARAFAVLEYELVGIDLVQGGNGYVATEPPRVGIRPPEQDPDWFIAVQEAPELRMTPLVESLDLKVQAKVTEMRSPDGNVAYSSMGNPTPPQVDAALIDLLQRDPLELLPSSLRPQLIPLYSTSGGAASYQYIIPSLPAIPAYTLPPSPRYRAFDPIFGGVGTVPVTKGALSLSASEYARLALSGALCTVAVRTVLNPLELIKTKQQLGNDPELNEFCIQQCATPSSPTSPSRERDPNSARGETSSATTRPSKGPSSRAAEIGSAEDAAALDSSTEAAPATATALLNGQEPAEMSNETDALTTLSTSSSDNKLGTMDLILSLIKLRGLGALFQSADITFLASLVFGSFGFGATELFRRSFTMAFFSDDNPGGGDGSAEQEVILLVAAALATVITSAAATPFEMLRVRSMGLVESQPWTQVFQDFMVRKAQRFGSVSSEIRLTTFALLQKDYGVDWEKKNSTVDLSPQSYLAMQKQDSMQKLPLSAFQDLASLAPLWGGFAPTLSRELPFAVTKFLCFDILAKAMINWINLNVVSEGALPVQVGVGALGLSISAIAGALAGVAGAVVSHPADLILTYTSVQRRGANGEATSSQDWKELVTDLIGRDGGIANLFVGLPVRSMFFYLVIGLQFFLYDYVKNFFQVGSDDLSLVLDVFYAVRAGLAGVDGGGGG